MAHILEGLEEWLNPHYIRFTNGKRGQAILVLEDFLLSTHAAALWKELSDKRVNWNSCVTDTKGKATLSVDCSAVPETSLFSRFDIGETSDLAFFRCFIDFTRGPVFLSWLSAAAGLDLHRLMEYRLTRFLPGHFIREHADSNDGRRLRANYYLAQDWVPNHGAQLFYRRRSGESAVEIPPLFNTLVLTPVIEGATHWVSTWTNPEPGRISIAFGFA